MPKEYKLRKNASVKVQKQRKGWKKMEEDGSCEAERSKIPQI